MFHSARLKLTAWYLLIIMFISVLFSMAFYNVADREIQRVIHRIEHIQQDPFDSMSPLQPPSPIINVQELEASERRLILTLILINVGILILAGCAGYFLAGRTLEPIQEMVNEQNRFITDASHELRTPITALKSEIEVYLRGEQYTEKETKELLKSNLEEVNNLQVLSENLLQLAQIEKPIDSISFDNLALVEILNEAARKVHSLAKLKRIEIHKELIESTVKGDKQSLTEVFVILLDNAIKYSPENTKVMITTESIDHSIAVHITDEGIGIDKKDIPHIFDRFYRADSSRTKQTANGYGLGLSIAKKVIELHKGLITVKSEKNKGTIFTVQLPKNV